jgi:hypothetical protein
MAARVSPRSPARGATRGRESEAVNHVWFICLQRFSGLVFQGAESTCGLRPVAAVPRKVVDRSIARSNRRQQQQLDAGKPQDRRSDPWPPPGAGTIARRGRSEEKTVFPLSAEILKKGSLFRAENLKKASLASLRRKTGK